MEKIDFRKSLDCYGRVSDVKLFTESYGVLPMRLSITHIEGLDLSNITRDLLFELFPDCVSILLSQCINLNKEDDSNEEDFNESFHNSLGLSGIVETHEYDVKDLSLYFDHAFITIGDDSATLFYDSNIKDPKKTIEDIIAKLPHKEIEPKPLTISVIGCSSGDFYCTFEKINKTKINIAKNYNDDFEPVYNRLVEFIKDTERQSGIALLRGIPGTGKTTVLRDLITNCPAKYIYITPAIAAHLSEPEFMSFLLENKDSIFILEDCEQVIMDREGMNVQTAVASLLNMSDGLMSDIFNGKFICTFNSDLDSVDKALLRPGRCVVNYDFRKLELSKTQALFKELYPDATDIPTEPQTLAEIFNHNGIVGNNAGEKEIIECGF